MSVFLRQVFGLRKTEPVFTGGFRPEPPHWDPYRFDASYLSMNDGDLLVAHYPRNEQIQRIIDRGDTLAAYLYRDPRDVAISAALYIKYGLKHHAFHKLFTRLSDDEAITFMLGGGIVCGEDLPDDMAAGRSDYVEFSGMRYFTEEALSWVADDRVVRVRFEDFVSRPGSIIAAFDERGIEVSSTVVNSVLERWHFAIASGGRSPGSEDKGAHFRKGVPGEFKRRFTPLHRAIAKRNFGADLIRLGFESDYAW
jgi:hypothetical protein